MEYIGGGGRVVNNEYCKSKIKRGKQTLILNRDFQRNKERNQRIHNEIQILKRLCFLFCFSLFLFLRVGNKFGIDKLFHTPFQINKIKRNERIHNEIQILNSYVSFSASLFFYLKQLGINLEFQNNFNNLFGISKEERNERTLKVSNT